MKYNGKLIKHTILVEQEVLTCTRPEHLSLFPFLCGICVSVALSEVSEYWFGGHYFFVFHFFVRYSVLHRYTAIDYTLVDLI